MLGMLSPASRGALMTAAIFLYVFMGLIAGYHSGRLYKTMKGKEWKRAAFLVSDLTGLFFWQLSNSISLLFLTTDGHPLSWIHGSNGVFPQLLHLGQTQQWSCPVYNNAQAFVLVALHLLPFGVCRLLLWLPKSAFRTARTD